MNYTGKLTVDPANHKLYGEISLTYKVQKEHNSLTLLLHKDIVVDDVSSKHLSSFIIEKTLSTDVPFVLEANRVMLTFLDRVGIDEEIRVDFIYHGDINIVTKYGINRITDPFVELGLYTPWYPLSVALEESTFDVTLTIPSNYTVINGYQLNKIGDSWQLLQQKPHSDCSFLAFKDGLIMGDDFVKVYYFKEQEPIAKQLLDTAKTLFDFFTDRFGVVSMDKHLSLAIPPRNDGGGYCRDGLIVLTLDDQDITKHIPFIAHEMAHLWWNKAPVNCWEDWLNESFAEYSSLMAVRSYLGLPHYQKRIDAYIKTSETLPPIKGIDRSDERAFLVLYKKGPVLLARLEHILGTDLFLALFKLTHDQYVISTKMFLTLLAEISTIKTAKKFEAWLEQ